jgi:hypothetical protein
MERELGGGLYSMFKKSPLTLTLSPDYRGEGKSLAVFRLAARMR